MLNEANEGDTVFAWQGQTSHKEALEGAIARAKRNFEIKTGKPSDRPTAGRPAQPAVCPGLQVINYYLWALQRLYKYVLADPRRDESCGGLYAWGEGEKPS